MGKKSRESRSKETKKTPPTTQTPWIEMGAGLKIIGVVSFLFAIFVFWQIYPLGGFVTALFYALAGAASLWLIVLVRLLINYLTRRRGSS